MRSTRQILAALSDAPGEDSLPAVLCRHCADDLGVDGAALILATEEGQQAVVGASTPLAETLENLQFEHGEGPSLLASATGESVFEPAFADRGPDRWPAFGRAAVDLGVASYYALPLLVGAIRLGSLGLHRTSPGGLDQERLAGAFSYSEAAVVVLLHLQSMNGSSSTLNPDLGDPLGYRAEIHQATGYLAVRASVGPTEALLLLRGHAFATGRPLLDVCRDVLAGTLEIPPPEGQI